MKQLLFLLLFPCLAMAQYQGNANQKITLGEQTTADGLIFRGLRADTTSKIVPFSDTSAYIILDTVEKTLWLYKAGQVPKWQQVGGSTLDTATMLLPYWRSGRFSGVLPVANGGTGSATQNFVDLTTSQTINGLKTFGYNSFETIGTSYTSYYQTSPNVSHGITGWLPNNAYSWQGPEDINNGGFSFVSATDANPTGALNFYGIMGSTAPTSNAIQFKAAKKMGQEFNH